MKDHTTEQRLALDLRSNETVRAFLSEPLSTVTAMIAAALASGREDLVLAGGRFVQAILKGRAFKQLGEELDELLKKGKIRSDYAETKHGFPSLVDLMNAIDNDATDEDKLRAAKAMFVALNAPDVPDGQANLRYQLLRLILTLTGSQIATLGACYILVKTRGFGEQPSMHPEDLRTWARAIGQQIGHAVLSLIEKDEEVLLARGILVNHPIGAVQLTDLGKKSGELLESYDKDVLKPNP